MVLDDQPTPGSVRAEWKLIGGLALAKLTLHLLSTWLVGYGHFVDELYYLACSEHLDWGYVDQAPLIAVITWAARTLMGESLPAIRFLPAVAGALTVALTGLMARELGGGRFAQGLACLAVMVAPVYLAMNALLTMNAFEPLFWMGCAWLVIRALKSGNEKLWLGFGLLAGLGLQNKHTMLLFGFAMFVGLLLTPQRSVLRRRWVWMGGLLAFAVFLPNLIWQMEHGFPMFELLRNIQKSGRNVSLTPVEFVLQQILLMHPLTFPLWLGGLWFFFRTEPGRPYRLLGWCFVVVLAVLLLLAGRVYYLAPAYPMLLAGGAVWLERLELLRRRVWMKPAYVGLMMVTGALLAPFSLPLLPPENYVWYSKTLHFEPPKIETHKMGPLPQLFADQFGWEEMAADVARVYKALPPEQRAKAAIFGNTYGQAGAIDLFGPKYGLPKSISTHQNYFLWGPRQYTGEVIIVLGDTVEGLSDDCQGVEVAGQHSHPYSMPYNHFPILICRQLKLPVSEAWARSKKWN